MLNVPTHWRIPPSFLDASPWGVNEHGRPLQILVDDATTSTSDALGILDELAGRLDAAVLHTGAAARWRVEVADQPDLNGALSVRFVSAAGVRESAILAGAGREEHARWLAAERGVSTESVLRLLRLDQLAHGFTADAIVTELDIPQSAGLAKPGLPLGFVGPERACSLLGLYLRAHNDFIVKVDGNRSTVLEPERFYLAAAVSALPAYPGWVHAAQLSWGQGSVELARLLRGIETRLARALHMRDYFAVRIRHWRPDDVWGECLTFFEAYLLFLDGAMDSAARFCGQAAGTSPKLGRPSWRRPAWVAGLKAADPRLAEILEPGGRLLCVAGALGVLRNLIHETPPTAELYLSTDRGREVMDHQLGVVVVDGRDAERLIEYCESLVGGASTWGITPGPHGTTVLPHVFLGRSLASVMLALGELMAATTADAAPRSALGFWMSGIEYAQRLRLLTGLPGEDDPGPRVTEPLRRR